MVRLISHFTKFKKTISEKTENLKNDNNFVFGKHFWMGNFFLSNRCLAKLFYFDKLTKLFRIIFQMQWHITFILLKIITPMIYQRFNECQSVEICVSPFFRVFRDILIRIVYFKSYAFLLIYDNKIISNRYLARTST